MAIGHTLEASGVYVSPCGIPLNQVSASQKRKARIRRTAILKSKAASNSLYNLLHAQRCGPQTTGEASSECTGDQTLHIGGELIQMLSCIEYKLDTLLGLSDLYDDGTGARWNNSSEDTPTLVGAIAGKELARQCSAVVVVQRFWRNYVQIKSTASEARATKERLREAVQHEPSGENSIAKLAITVGTSQCGKCSEKVEDCISDETFCSVCVRLGTDCECSEPQFRHRSCGECGWTQTLPTLYSAEWFVLPESGILCVGCGDRTVTLPNYIEASAHPCHICRRVDAQDTIQECDAKECEGGKLFHQSCLTHVESQHGSGYLCSTCMAYGRQPYSAHDDEDMDESSGSTSEHVPPDEEGKQVLHDDHAYWEIAEVQVWIRVTLKMVQNASSESESFAILNERWHTAQLHIHPSMRSAIEEGIDTVRQTVVSK